MVIESADMAMDRAKGLGRGRFALFEPAMRLEASLLEFGCDFGQGYLDGRPLPIQEAGRQWLR